MYVSKAPVSPRSGRARASYQTKHEIHKMIGIRTVTFEYPDSRETVKVIGDEIFIGPHKYSAEDIESWLAVCTLPEEHEEDA